MKRTNYMVLLLLGMITLLLAVACSARQETPVSSIGDLNDPQYTIAVPQGTPPEEVVKEYLPRAKIAYFPQITDEVAALKSGQVSAICYDSSAISRMLVNNPDLIKLPGELGKIEIAAVTRKADRDLYEQVNVFIRQLEEDGTSDEMYSRWIEHLGGKMPDLPEPENPGQKLKIITNGLVEPMNFYENGVLTGYDIEFAKRFAYFANVQYEFITMDFDGMIPALQSGRGDIIISDYYKTAEREESVGYSDTYVVLRNSVVVRKGMYDGAVQSAGGTLTTNEQLSGTAQGGTLMAAQLTSLKNSYVRTFIVEDRYKLVLHGLRTTIIISLLSVLFGSLLGFLVCALRRSPYPPFSVAAKVYIRLIQGVPILLILMILYYILFAGVDIDPVLIAVVGFSINFSAYSAEIFRTAIDATDQGQIEAAYALGFSKSGSFIKITLPQALRHIIPVFKGEFISMVKMTSVVGYIAIQDLTKMSDIIRARTFEAYFPLFATAFIYFVITYLFVLLLSGVEKRIDPKMRKRIVRGVDHHVDSESGVSM